MTSASKVTGGTGTASTSTVTTPQESLILSFDGAGGGQMNSNSVVASQRELLLVDPHHHRTPGFQVHPSPAHTHGLKLGPGLDLDLNVSVGVGVGGVGGLDLVELDHLRPPNSDGLGLDLQVDDHDDAVDDDDDRTRHGPGHGHGPNLSFELPPSPLLAGAGLDGGRPASTSVRDQQQQRSRRVVVESQGVTPRTLQPLDSSFHLLDRHASRAESVRNGLEQRYEERGSGPGLGHEQAEVQEQAREQQDSIPTGFEPELESEH